MTKSQLKYFIKFGLKTFLLRKKDPILGTIILTDKCNLKCRHCSVTIFQLFLNAYTHI